MNSSGVLMGIYYIYLKILFKKNKGLSNLNLIYSDIILTFSKALSNKKSMLFDFIHFRKFFYFYFIVNYMNKFNLILKITDKSICSLSVMHKLTLHKGSRVSILNMCYYTMCVMFKPFMLNNLVSINLSVINLICSSYIQLEYLSLSNWLYKISFYTFSATTFFYIYRFFSLFMPLKFNYLYIYTLYFNNLISKTTFINFFFIYLFFSNSSDFYLKFSNKLLLAINSSCLFYFFSKKFAADYMYVQNSIKFLIPKVLLWSYSTLFLQVYLLISDYYTKKKNTDKKEKLNIFKLYLNCYFCWSNMYFNYAFIYKSINYESFIDSNYRVLSVNYYSKLSLISAVFKIFFSFCIFFLYIYINNNFNSSFKSFYFFKLVGSFENLCLDISDLSIAFITLNMFKVYTTFSSSIYNFLSFKFYLGFYIYNLFRTFIITFTLKRNNSYFSVYYGGVTFISSTAGQWLNEFKLDNERFSGLYIKGKLVNKSYMFLTSMVKGVTWELNFFRRVFTRDFINKKYLTVNYGRPITMYRIMPRFFLAHGKRKWLWWKPYKPYYRRWVIWRRLIRRSLIPYRMFNLNITDRWVWKLNQKIFRNNIISIFGYLSSTSSKWLSYKIWFRGKYLRALRKNKIYFIYYANIVINFSYIYKFNLLSSNNRDISIKERPLIMMPRIRDGLAYIFGNKRISICKIVGNNNVAYGDGPTPKVRHRRKKRKKIKFL